MPEENEVSENNALERDLQETIPSFWQGLPPESRQELLRILPRIISVTVSRSRRFSGPLPPSEMLKEYDQLIPNGAERIMSMAEQQSTHRQQLESTTVASQNKQSERGQLFAFILAILFMVTGTVAFLTEHNTVAGTIFGTTIVGLVTVFIFGKTSQMKDLRQKASSNERSKSSESESAPES